MRAFTIFVLIGVLLVGVGAAPQSAEAMNKAELIDSIASEADITKADGKKALDAFIDTTTKALQKGNRVSLIEFGSFIVKKRSEQVHENGRKTVKVQFRANDGQANAPEHADLSGEIVTQDELSEMMVRAIDADADGDGFGDPERIVDRFFAVFADVVHDTLADGDRVSLGEDEFGVFYLPMGKSTEKERGITINVRHQLADIDDTIGEVQEALAECGAQVCASVLESSDEREGLIADADRSAGEGDLKAVERTLEKVQHIVRGDIERIEHALSDERELHDTDEEKLRQALQLEKKLDKKISKLQRLLDKKHNKHQRTDDSRSTVVTGQIEQGVVEQAGGDSDVERYNEITNVQDMDSNTEVIEYIQSKVGEIIKINTPPGLIDEVRDDDEVTFELKEGRKGMNAFDVRRTDLRETEDGKTVGTGKITVIIERDGNSGGGITIRDNESGEEYYVKSKRKGRNPQTGKEIKIPTKKVVKFKPGAELSNKVK